MTKYQALRSTGSHDPRQADIGAFSGRLSSTSRSHFSRRCLNSTTSTPIRDSCILKSRDSCTNGDSTLSTASATSISRRSSPGSCFLTCLSTGKKHLIKASHHIYPQHPIQTDRQALITRRLQPVSLNMRGKMSLSTLLNPKDLEPGGSASARSTPDPATPSSITSVPDPWAATARLPPLHRRNDSFESTTSTSSSQKSQGLDRIRYPPFNNLDANSRQLAMRFNVEPLGAIVPSPRPVSYNSDKRELKAKTGLSKFHGSSDTASTYGKEPNKHQVFQYSFQLEGEEKKWVVMWDFRLGLVRFTPFFKCLKYSKVS